MKIEPKKYHEYSAVEQVTLRKRHTDVLEYLLALLKSYIKNPSDFSASHSRKQSALRLKLSAKFSNITPLMKKDSRPQLPRMMTMP